MNNIKQIVREDDKGIRKWVYKNQRLNKSEKKISK